MADDLISHLRNQVQKNKQQPTAKTQNVSPLRQRSPSPLDPDANLHSSPSVIHVSPDTTAVTNEDLTQKFASMQINQNTTAVTNQKTTATTTVTNQNTTAVTKNIKSALRKKQNTTATLEPRSVKFDDTNTDLILTYNQYEINQIYNNGSNDSSELSIQQIIAYDDIKKIDLSLLEEGRDPNFRKKEPLNNPIKHSSDTNDGKTVISLENDAISRENQEFQQTEVDQKNVNAIFIEWKKNLPKDKKQGRFEKFLNRFKKKSI